MKLLALTLAALSASTTSAAYTAEAAGAVCVIANAAAGITATPCAQTAGSPAKCCAGWTSTTTGLVVDKWSCQTQGLLGKGIVTGLTALGSAPTPAYSCPAPALASGATAYSSLLLACADDNSETNCQAADGAKAAGLTTLTNCCGSVTSGTVAVTVAKVCVDPAAVAFAKIGDSTLVGVCNGAAKVAGSFAAVLLASLYLQ